MKKMSFVVALATLFLASSMELKADGFKMSENIGSIESNNIQLTEESTLLAIANKSKEVFSSQHDACTISLSTTVIDKRGLEITVTASCTSDDCASAASCASMGLGIALAVLAN